MSYSDGFSDALRYAADAHKSQLRKGTSTPYASHLLAVASLVMEAGGDEEEAIAALLHDAGEDQGGEPRLEDIGQRFGARVAAIVRGCSDSLEQDPKKKAPSLQRKAEYIVHLRACEDRSVYLVSVADKLHNSRNMLMDIERSGIQIWNRFNAKPVEIIENYRDLLSAYRAGPDDRRRNWLVDELENAVDALAVKTIGSPAKTKHQLTPTT